VIRINNMNNFDGLILIKETLRKMRLIRIVLLEIIRFILISDYFNQPLYIHSMFDLNVFNLAITIKEWKTDEVI